MKRRKEWLTLDEALVYVQGLGVTIHKQMFGRWVRDGRLSRSGKRVYLHSRPAGGDPSYLMFRPDWIDKFLEEVNS